MGYLLVEFNINGTTNQLSTEGVALDSWWDNKIAGFDTPEISMNQDYGGYCKLNAGDISFNPELFSTDWPPPVNGAIKIYYTADTEANKKELFEGMAHVASINREEIRYELHANAYDTELSTGATFNDSLINVFTWGCGELGLNLDSSKAQGSTSKIIHTLTSDRLLIDTLSDFAAFYTHLFYIKGSTLHLVSMATNNGTRTITEFDFFPSQYTYNVPTKYVTNDDYTIYSTYVYGDAHETDAYHSAGATISSAFSDILTYLNKPRVSLRIPLKENMPDPGEKISYQDESLVQILGVSVFTRSIQLDFKNDEFVIDGDASIAAL